MTIATIMPVRITKAKPCANCPWRRDAVGRNTQEEIETLRACAAPDGQPQGCHCTYNSPKPRACAGYLERVGRHRADVALPAAFSGVLLHELRSPVPLFHDYVELFAAYGVAP